MRLFPLIGAGVFAVVLLFVGLAGCSTVDNGYRGVLTSYGKPYKQVGEGGPYFLNPFSEDMIHMKVRNITWTSNTEAYTYDVQQAAVKFTINYNLQPDKALAVYRKYGEGWDDQLTAQIVEQTIKDVFGQSRAVGDIINKRADVTAKIKTLLRTRFAANSINVADFQLRDVEFSPAFEKAVEQKQVAVENALAAKNKTVQYEEEAKQKIITAQADAEAMRIQSQALTTNSALVQWEAIKKWDGVLPQNMYGGGAIPFIQAK